MVRRGASLNANKTRRHLWKNAADADGKLKRLYRLVEDGFTDPDEVLSDRRNALKATRDQAKAALERAKKLRLRTSKLIVP